VYVLLLQALREQILAKHPNKKFATDSDCEVRACRKNRL
jgi:hypothetical protein